MLLFPAMTICGLIRISMASCVLVWPCMALYGLAWPCMALYGLVWPCMTLYGLVWPSLAFYGLLWQNIVFSRGHRSKFIWSCLQSKDLKHKFKATRLDYCVSKVIYRLYLLSNASHFFSNVFWTCFPKNSKRLVTNIRSLFSIFNVENDINSTLYSTLVSWISLNVRLI